MNWRTFRRISSTSGGNEKSIMVVSKPAPVARRLCASGRFSRVTIAGRYSFVRSLQPMTKAAWDRETLPEGDDKARAVRQMFDAIAPRYDLVNRIMTFRLDVRWRRKAVALLHLARGSTVLDLAGGTGDLCIDLARGGLRPISVDFSFGMLAADRSGAPRVQADILTMPFCNGSVDGVTCG